MPLMPRNHSLLRAMPWAAILLAAGLAHARPALAAHCGLTGSPSFNFGSVRLGEAASTTAAAQYTCAGDPGQALYIRVCLAPAGNPPLYMKAGSARVSYALYSASQPDSPLQSASAQGWAQATIFADGDRGVPGSFPLLAKIPGGQTSLAAGDYHDNDEPLYLAYASAENENMLPECSMATAHAAGVLGAQVNIANTCEIQNVSPMNFGTLSAAGGAPLSADATARLDVQCPVGQAISIGLNNGLHAGANGAGAPRSLCGPAGGCVGYDLYQDSGHTRRWGDQRNVDTLQVPASTGANTSYTIYGKIPSQPWPAPGTYSDTVTVTLTY